MSDRIDSILSKLFVALILFLAGFATATRLESDPAQLEADGKYKVLFVRKMFNSQTGQPTYYVLAAPIIKTPNGMVETNRFHLYEVPRDKISNIKSDNKPDERPVLWLHMANGHGALLQEDPGQL